jgi:hypothetical protein
MIKVFVSGPYTLGNVEDNITRMIDASNELIDNGFNPLPLNVAYHPIETKYPRKRYVDWIDITYEWVEKCDCLLRLTGESKGADGEVKIAEELKIPVFYSTIELIKYYKK